MKRLYTLPFLQNSVLRNRRSPRLPGLGLEKYADALKASWQKLLLLGMFALGLFLGAKTAAGVEPGWQENLVALLRAQRLNRMAGSIMSNAVVYLGTDLLFLAAAFLLGICAGGLPLLLLLPVLRGLGIGAVSGWLYLSYGASGIGYSVLVLYPAAVVSILVMLSGCRESLLMSGDMLLMVTGKAQRAETGLRLYASRYVVLLLVSVLAAAMDALCFSAFSGVFEI